MSFKIQDSDGRWKELGQVTGISITMKKFVLFELIAKGWVYTEKITSSESVIKIEATLRRGEEGDGFETERCLSHATIRTAIGDEITAAIIAIQNQLYEQAIAAELIES